MRTGLALIGGLAHPRQRSFLIRLQPQSAFANGVAVEIFRFAQTGFGRLFQVNQGVGFRDHFAASRIMHIKQLKRCGDGTGRRGGLQEFTGLYHILFRTQPQPEHLAG